MSENIILAELKDVKNELKNLTGAILTHDTILNKVSETISGSVSKQVYTMKELAIRWDCSETYARKIVSKYKIPLVLGAHCEPRKPHCVLRFELEKYEYFQSSKKLEVPKISYRPPIGKTARGFVPFKNKSQVPVVFSKDSRLGDLKK